MPERRRRASVTTRLAIAFVAVALAAVGLFAALTVAVESSDVSQLARQQTDDLADAVAATAAGAYRVHAGWAGTDLSDALSIANAVGGRVRITDASGRPVGTTRGRLGITAVSARVPVLVDGRTVGTVELSVGSGGVGQADAHLRHALAVGLAGSAAAAALLAVGAAVIMADRLSRPLRRLTAVARAMTAGDRAARVGVLAAPRELAELGEAYDTMATSVEEEDRLRRANAAHVAHELRTPLAILLASTESLLDGVSQPTAENLSSLRDEALRLATRVEDLEMLASAEAAGLSMHRAPLDLAAVVDDAADALTERFATAGVILRRQLVPAWVAGDPGRLHQVITNLLTNAVKFSPEGGTVTLAVRIEAGTAVLSVADTGPGIGPEEVPRVFEPFWRGRAATSVAGSGVGLAVVAELVAAHGGQVSVETGQGEGATFRVVLPLLEPAPPEAA